MIYILIAIPAFLMVIYFAYKWLRPKFPVRVQCWFCGQKTSVLYEFRNCWDCCHCEQYNGFDKDGSYNKPIPAQYDERLNQPVSSRQEEFLGGHEIFCHRCSQNQLLKIKQLANFVPYEEKNYDYEVAAFKNHLEKVYRLCPQCEVRVQQELEYQNEALGRRYMMNLTDSQYSLLEQDADSIHVLHSSYTDRRMNVNLMISLCFHGMAMVCGLLLAARQLNLDGQEGWQRQLLFLHPVLLWIDRNADIIGVVGLFTSVAAKLMLGKYRLHIVDAVSCPVWLLVFLSEYGVTGTEQWDTVYKTAGLVLNCLTSIACLAVNRHLRNQSNLNVTRQTLDSSFSDTASSVSPFSSVSQVTSRSSERSSSCHENNNALKTRNRLAEEKVNSEVDSSVNNSKCVQIKKEETSRTNDLQTNDSGLDLESVEETASELNSFSLGEPTIKRSNSGIFSTVSQSGFESSSNTVIEQLRSRKVGEKRPLISPAAFNHSSTPHNHKKSSAFERRENFGLFSQPPSREQQSFSFQDGLFTSSRSAFTPTKLFSSQRHSFTPERPGSPVVTSFGAAPFPDIPQESDRLSQISQSSFIGNTRPHSVTKKRESVAKQRLFMPVGRTKLPEDSDDDLSDFTYVTNRCAVDSTTDSATLGKSQTNSISTVLCHPGVVGFILGGSMVANLLLGLAWLKNPSIT